MNALPRRIAVAALFLAAGLTAFSQSREETEKWLNNLQLQPGKTVIQNGAVAVDLPDAYRFIKAEDARKILEDVWRNPPNPSVLGMVVPKDFSPTQPGSSIVVVLQDDPTGYVSDKDAASIDYDKMLKDIQSTEPDLNKEREKEGYPPMNIVGWAERPYYDQAAHKLYWAKEIKFGDSPENTLNYNVRILGRRGVLELNAIANIDQLAQVKAAMPSILTMVNYQEGNRYTDFDPHIDKVAGYGLAALIVGGVAAKAGLFKGLIIAVLALKKFVIMGVIALVAYFKRMVRWVKGLFGQRET